MYTYTLKENLYINLTNKCTDKCSFCIRDIADGLGGSNLWLEKEPETREIIQAVGNPEKYEEIVFCGFGEPLMRLEQVLEVSRYLKDNYNTRIRLNTNGQANLIYGRNIVPLLEGLIDSVSISLNAKNAEDYQRLCKPEYGEEAYYSVLDFIKECRKYIPEVTITVVDVIPEEDITQCEAIAAELGVKFRVRHFGK
jgi:TatD family-associated radical SAM protein